MLFRSGRRAGSRTPSRPTPRRPSARAPSTPARGRRTRDRRQRNGAAAKRGGGAGHAALAPGRRRRGNSPQVGVAITATSAATFGGHYRLPRVRYGAACSGRAWTGNDRWPYRPRWLIRRALAGGQATARPGRLGITEYYRFVEENPADSRVFFHLGVKFHDLAELPGLAGRMVRQRHICAADAGDLSSGSANGPFPGSGRPIPRRAQTGRPLRRPGKGRLPPERRVPMPPKRAGLLRVT